MEGTWLTQLQMLQHRATRDLAWAALSPPLLENLPELPQLPVPENKEILWQWLVQQDQAPDALHEYLARQPHRLGLYFEALWQFLLMHAPLFNEDCTLLAHNLPVYQQLNKGRQTAGAFDFILQRGNHYLPLEIAVKFYLGVPARESFPGDWHAWPGPDSRDSAAGKFQHLAQHQLQLGNTDAGRALLRQTCPSLFPAPARCIIKGYFFYPAEGDIAPPQHAHAHHLRGQWWYAEHFLRAAPDNRFIFLPKARWLAPATAAATETQNKVDLWRGLVDEEQHHFPVMLAEMQPSNDRWYEYKRHCLVPDHWPGTAPC